MALVLSMAESQMSRRADADLLFGLLALQNGLIDQGTLFSAFAAWAREKGPPMAEILVRDGAIQDRDRELLDRLVARHAERHGGDSNKGLAALGPGAIAAVRVGIEAIGDPDLAASLPPDAGESYGTVYQPSIGAPTSGGGRFQVLRPLARGGLGEVSVARDNELNREVALKEIRERYADRPQYRERFEFEAEVTGSLEHPGIVPIYGLGRDLQGRPFYAMKLIRGATLKEAIDASHRDAEPPETRAAHGLAFRRLLRHLLDVCDAVEYAHQKGVIHRDIKPGNIMLGEHGETLVVDWGLAKRMGRAGPSEGDHERGASPQASSGSSETLPGTAIGTPEFMSPEQAAGQLDRIGPTSDVYSLGATLYYLLTGKRPFEDDDPGRLLRRVAAGDFRPPRQLDPSIDPALDAVCRKAMATSQVDRYASARSLADDIERWMADEPVTALDDPLPVKAARWARRHRTFAAVAAVFLLVASASSMLGAWLIDRQRAVAIRHRALAESNLARARDVVDEMYTRVAEETEDVPLMDGYQRTILEKARAFYEEEALPQSQARATRLAAAGTQLRLATVLLKLGRVAEARPAAERALGLFEALSRDGLGGADAIDGRAEVNSLLGRIAVESRDYRAAAWHFRLAIMPRSSVGRMRAGDVGEYLALASDRRRLAEALHLGRQLAEADLVFHEALETLEAATAEWPDDRRFRRILAHTLEGLARLRTEGNRDAEAEPLLRRSLAIREAELRARPGDPKARSDVAQARSNLAYTLGRLGRGAESEDLLRDAIARSESLLLEHPELPWNRLVLARALSHRASLRLEQGRPDAAVADGLRALEVLRSGPAGADSREALARVAAVLHDLARAERAGGRPTEARAHARESDSACEAIDRAGLADPSIRILWGQARCLQGLAARDLGNADDAIDSFRQALDTEEVRPRRVPRRPAGEGGDGRRPDRGAGQDAPGPRARRRRPRQLPPGRLDPGRDGGEGSDRPLQPRLLPGPVLVPGRSIGWRRRPSRRRDPPPGRRARGLQRGRDPRRHRPRPASSPARLPPPPG